ncbi:hypothetical protein PsYK624_079770 [Phanerochaete sordida]|uniref:Uncharacterized protein n=1 Tax=Phanerochaete sordida TaxID=48140 RepID=A0A9P3LDT1_9APHY|nr:hypothetical protein PsYK624_079770 [Phanerochaete sordida]
MAEAMLPEEMIHEIIRLSLPPFCPKTFLKFDRTLTVLSPTQQEPGTITGPVALLSVSKRWLRVGTPLLYEGVVLRKPSHTSSVARLAKANPTVGRTIRYLRLESGSTTRELSTLVKHAPNVHTVYIEGCLRHGDSYDGLQRAMRFLRPKTLYINNPFCVPQESSRNVSRETNKMVLKAIVEAWTSATALHFSSHYIAIGNEWSSALQLPSLEELHIPAPHYAPQYWFSWSRSLPHPPFKRLILYATRHREHLKAELTDSSKHISYAETVDFVDGSN